MFKRFLMVTLFVLALSSTCYAAERFIYLGTTDTYTEYFDSETVKLGKTSDGYIDAALIDVWTKCYFYKDGQVLGYSLRHYQINSKSKQYVMLRYIVFGNNGQSEELSCSQQWRDIVPESAMEQKLIIVEDWILNNIKLVVNRSK